MENYLINEVYQNKDIFEQIHDGCDMLGIDLFDVCCVCEYLCDVWVKRYWNTKVECGFVIYT